ncbi:MAG: M48 family metallopeptidase [Persicimonas sp.]
MMTNFFEHQDVARRNTLKLVVLFCAALIATSAAVYAAVYVTIYLEPILVEWLNAPMGSPVEFSEPSFWWHTDLFLLCFGGTLAVIGAGSLFKVRQLAKGGGSAVIEQLGGRFMDLNTDDPDEQRFINVVEEMCIASGTSRPLLYVLDDEPGINAMAAGFSTNNAALAISRGALEALNRDELQGVVAHEFSHIVNGDMRLNIRLIGALHGLMMVSVAGKLLLYGAAVTSNTMHRSKHQGDPGCSGVIHLFFLGALLTAIGFFGRMCGRMIQSAISRQREYLADAAAVQFTRNPDGLTGALKKIGGYRKGAAIESPIADEMGHMFFGETHAEPSWLDRFFATHPPLKDRVRRLDKSFVGAFPEFVPAGQKERERQRGNPDLKWEARTAADGPAEALEVEGLDLGETAAEAVGSYAAGTLRVDPNAVTTQVGEPTAEHLDHARDLLDSLPDPLLAARREPHEAAAVVFALLITSDEEATRKQLEMLDGKLTKPLRKKTRAYAELIRELDAAVRLPLLELLVPALRRMAPSQLDSFRRLVRDLIEADDRVTLFEFSLEQVLLHRLEETYSEDTTPTSVRYRTVSPLLAPIELLLSFLAHAGSDDADGAKTAFAEARANANHKRLANDIELRPEERCSFEELDEALGRIAQASLPVKQHVIDAAAHCVLADDEVIVEEAELLRAVCEVIDAPLPPFLPAA